MAEKNRIDTRGLRINFSLLLLFLILGYFLYLIKNDISKMRSLSNEKQSVSSQIGEQESLRKTLYRKLKLLKQGSFIEMLAREKLGLIKQGESAYKVINQ